MGIQIAEFQKKRKTFTLGEINFDLQSGYILGVVGRNGSGKSTLFQSMLFGDCKDGGTITINGLDGGKDGEERRDYRRQCAFVLEAFPFTDSLTAKEIGKIYGPFYQDFDFKKYQELLAQLEIPQGRRMKKLSAGMKLKVQMAFAFSYASRVLFLDEPTASLDSFARKDLYRLIGEYMESGDRNVIWATHLTDELDRMADYLLFLENGKQTLFDEKEALLSRYRIIKGSKQQLDECKQVLLGRTDRDTYSEGMVKAEDAENFPAERIELPDIEQLLFYLYGQKRSISDYANVCEEVSSWIKK